MWQKCPICLGVGNTGFNKCSTCNGTKIISELSGLPPNYEQNAKVDRDNNFNKSELARIYPLTPKDCTDFRDGNIETQEEYFNK